MIVARAFSDYKVLLAIVLMIGFFVTWSILCSDVPTKKFQIFKKIYGSQNKLRRILAFLLSTASVGAYFSLNFYLKLSSSMGPGVYVNGAGWALASYILGADWVEKLEGGCGQIWLGLRPLRPQAAPAHHD